MPRRLREPDFYEAKRRAYLAVARERRAGRLRPEPCECGSTRDLQAHHRWGYEGSNATRVVWLCVRCHIDEHTVTYRAKITAALRDGFRGTAA